MSCSVEPVKIEVGTDMCSHCKMTISDKRFGAEMLLSTGKAYKFDAIECMIQFTESQEFDNKEFQLLATDFMTADSLHPVENLTFLRSNATPSPMGYYLSAFKNKADIKMVLEQNSADGETYTFSDLKQFFNTLSPSH